MALLTVGGVVISRDVESDGGGRRVKRTIADLELEDGVVAAALFRISLISQATGDQVILSNFQADSGGGAVVEQLTLGRQSSNLDPLQCAAFGIGKGKVGRHEIMGSIFSDGEAGMSAYRIIIDRSDVNSTGGSRTVTAAVIDLETDSPGTGVRSNWNCCYK